MKFTESLRSAFHMKAPGSEFRVQGSGFKVPGSEVPRLVGDTNLFNKINRVGPESLKRLTLNLEPGTLNLEP